MTLPLASFKGVEFRVEQAAAELGRRNVLHEYPFRDVPVGEDLGRAARHVSVTAFFFGEDGPAQLDLLLEVLESPGPGSLRHPWLGYHWCQLDGLAKVRYPAAAGGRITVELAFVEAGANWEPAAQVDSTAQLSAALDGAQQAADQLLAADWPGQIAGVAEAAGQVVEQLCARLESTLSPLEASRLALQRQINAIQHIIDSPLLLAGRLQQRIQSMQGMAQAPFSGLSLWTQWLAGRAAAGPVLPAAMTGEAGETGGALGANRWLSAVHSAGEGGWPLLPPALDGWLQQTLLLEAMRSLPQAEFGSAAALQQTHVRLLAMLDGISQQAADVLFAPLGAVRVALAAALLEWQPGLAGLVRLQTVATLPALVLAYQVNGDVRAEADLVARNAVRHPGFVPPGVVEVLSHGQ